MDELQRYRAEVDEHCEVVRRFFDRHSKDLDRAAEGIASVLRTGGKVLLFGNGGSAADAQHLAAEWVNRMAADRPAMAALALSTDTSILTSIANDSSYDRVFARQIEALGRAGDAAVAISTSGNSPNIIQGLTRARDLGILTIGLLGRDGGLARGLCDHPLVVEHPGTARIQEVHILIGHLLCGQVERILHPSPPGR